MSANPYLTDLLNSNLDSSLSDQRGGIYEIPINMKNGTKKDLQRNLLRKKCKMFERAQHTYLTISAGNCSC